MANPPTSDFRGRGWAFPILPGPNGGLGYTEADDNIVQSVELLLRTVAGERLMRPDLGTTVPSLLFEADSEQNLHRLEVAVSDAIRQFEPRVEVEQVVATASPRRDSAVGVAVSYRVLRTNTKRNMVFPFMFDGGAPGGGVDS